MSRSKCAALVVRRRIVHVPVGELFFCGASKPDDLDVEVKVLSC
jgi:hypothetical protein